MNSIKNKLFFIPIFMASLSCSPNNKSNVKVTNGYFNLGDLFVFQIETTLPKTRALSECSATLIAPNILLTAAHCVKDRETVRMKGLYTYQASEIRIHPHYGVKGPSHDIALIKLSGVITTIKPASISSLSPKADMPVKIVGFGENQYGKDSNVATGTGAGIKRFGFNKISHMDENFIYTKGLFDATPAGSNRPTGTLSSSAPGDSGGPLFDEKGEIIGVASKTNIHALSSKNPPLVLCAYVRIETFKDFMIKTMKEWNYQP